MDSLSKVLGLGLGIRSALGRQHLRCKIQDSGFEVSVRDPCRARLTVLQFASGVSAAGMQEGTL